MDLTGHTLGRYRIIEKIGSGGMADVYRAHQDSLSRDVAIKVLPPSLCRDETFRARFRREARAVAQLHHPNILTVFDYGEQDGMIYIVMELATGRTLKDRMREPLSLFDAIEIVCRLGSALAYAHRRGVVHRDVKPSNILITDDGWPLLSDFGLAKIAKASQELTRSGVSIGTPEYMSPEQGEGSTADHRSDIYSLGVVLYELVTGQPPYASETPMGVIVKHMTAPLPSPREFKPDLPTSIEYAIVKSMAKSPADRFESATEMIEILEQALQQMTKSLPDLPEQEVSLPESVVQPYRHLRRKKALLTAATLALLALLIIGGGMLAWNFIPGLPQAVASFLRPATPTPVSIETSPLASTVTSQPTETETAPPMPSATATQAQQATSLPAASPTPVQTPTWTPTPTCTPTLTSTPMPQAVARVGASVFEGPHSGTEELAIVAARERVDLLGRADSVRYGRWLHVRTAEGIEGFVDEPRFTYQVEWESLNICPVNTVRIVATPTPSYGTLSIAPGPLRIEHIWPAGVCTSEKPWIAYFEVKIAGGDGKSYQLYWDQEPIVYTVKTAEPDVAVVQRQTERNLLVGTIRVESGGQLVDREASAMKPDQCK